MRYKRSRVAVPEYRRPLAAQRTVAELAARPAVLGGVSGACRCRGLALHQRVSKFRCSPADPTAHPVE